MSFPQKSDPKIIHLFIDDTPFVLGAYYLQYDDIFNFCNLNCINFLCLEELSDYVTNQGNKEILSEFVQSGYESGICDFSFKIDLFDVNTNGLNDFNLLISYNSQYSGTSLINWFTVKNNFLDLTSVSSVTYTNSVTTSTNSSTITLTNGVTTSNLYLSTIGNIININGYYRQIKQILNLTTIVVDRPIPITLNNVNLTVYDNATLRILDFDTFLYRLKLLKTAVFPYNYKIEHYTSRSTNATQLKKISSFVDRILIENDYDLYNYPLYNTYGLNTVRQTLYNLSRNKTGTIAIANGSNLIVGTGTDFANDISLGSKIQVSGQVFTINSINLSSPQQAIVSEVSPITITNATYTTYFDFLPIYNLAVRNDSQTELVQPTYLPYPLRSQWLLTPLNSKSFVDVYRFFTLSGYTKSGNVQSGISPICYNAETDNNIINTTNLVGLSISNFTIIEEYLTNDSNNNGYGIPDSLCSVCSEESYRTINNFNISYSASNPTCDSANNGSVIISTPLFSLVTPYVYNFSGNTNISVTGSPITVGYEELFYYTGLTSGNWILMVQDSNGTISNQYPFTLIKTFNPTVETSGNTIIFNLIGGTSPYDISGTSFSVSGLSAGTYVYSGINNQEYSFIISDSNTCVSDKFTVTINTGSTLAISITNSTNPTCSNAANGTITTTINDFGTPPYDFILNNVKRVTTSAITYTFTSATPELWSVYVQDSLSAISNTDTIILSSTYDPTGFASGINKIKFNLTGGTPPYKIISNNGNAIPFSPPLGYTVNSDGIIGPFTVPSGNISFTISDVNNCSKIVVVDVQESPSADLTVTNFVNPNCDEVSNGSVTLSFINAIYPVYFSAINANQVVTQTVSNPLINAVLFTGLTSGNWGFTLMDSSPVPLTNYIGQQLSENFSVNYTISATPTTSTICINASGGTLGNYTVDINGQLYLYDTGSTVNCYSGICGTVNTIRVVDGDIINTSLSGCVYTAQTFILCSYNVLYTANTVSCNGASDGSITLQGVGGVPKYGYQLEQLVGSTLVNYSQSSTGALTFSPLGSGIWTATTTDYSGNVITQLINLDKDFSFSATTTNQVGNEFCVTITGGTPPYIIKIVRGIPTI